MNKLAKMIGIADAKNGRPMDNSIFETELEKDYYQSAYEQTLGEMRLNELGVIFV